MDREMRYASRDYAEWKPLNRRRRSDRIESWIGFVLVILITAAFISEVYMHLWRFRP